MHEITFGKQLSFKEMILLFVAMVFLICAGITHRSTDKPGLNIQKQDSAVNINRNLLKFLNLGNKRLIADLLWIQTLLEGDEEHYSKLDLNSWMYHRFMSIADMDPLFYENYLHGGMYLSIVKDDPLGAAELFEMGLQYYASDYRLNYNAGYNYIFELKDNKKGLYYLEKIINDSRNPPFFSSIISKIRYEIDGNADAAILFLKNRIDHTQDPYLRKKIKNEIYALKAEYDLNCLNQGLLNCDKYDSDGRPYIKSKDIWHSVKPFNKFRLGHQKK